MINPDTFFGIGLLVAILFMVLGCISLHRRLRTGASLWLLLSVLLLGAWFPIAVNLNDLVWNRIVLGDLSNAYSAVLLFNELVMPVLLLLSAAISFWLVARSVGKRANHPFKPTPTAQPNSGIDHQ